MKYGKTILILRFMFYLYKCWHLYKSNNDFVNQLKYSKTYNSILSIQEYTNNIKECSDLDIKLPYLLRLSEFTMTHNATLLYKSIYKITQCIQDPEILTKQFMEFIYINNSYKSISESYSKELKLYNREFTVETSYEGIKELYKLSHDIEYFSNKLLLSNIVTESEYKTLLYENAIRNPKKKIIMTTINDWYYVDIFIGASYEISEEIINYFFVSPTHTPLYDKFTQIQTKMKSYYRFLDESYRQMNYLAVDIMDELALFTTKFHTSIQSTVSLYYLTGFLLIETVGCLYYSDNTVFMIEGIHSAITISLNK